MIRMLGIAILALIPFMGTVPEAKAQTNSSFGIQINNGNRGFSFFRSNNSFFNNSSFDLSIQRFRGNRAFQFNLNRNNFGNVNRFGNNVFFDQFGNPIVIDNFGNARDRFGRRIFISNGFGASRDAFGRRIAVFDRFGRRVR